MNLEDLENIFSEQGNITIRAYYKIKRGLKYYYDYSLEDESNSLKGSFDRIKILELLYYLEELYIYKE